MTSSTSQGHASAQAAIPVVELIFPDESRDPAEVAQHFLSLISGHQSITVVVQLYSVGSSNSYLDLTADFAEASYIAEMLAQHAQQFDYAWRRPEYRLQLHLTLSGFFPEHLAEELSRMAILANASDEEQWRSETYMEERDACFAHEEDLHCIPLRLPELADHYHVNLVNGAYFEWEEPEAVAEQLRRFPERRFGFCVSRTPLRDGLVALTSPDTWLLPSDIEAGDLLDAIEVGRDQLLPGQLLSLGAQTLVIAPHAAVSLRTANLWSAVACGAEFFKSSGDDIGEMLRFGGELRLDIASDGRRSASASVSIGEFGTSVRITCKNFQILFLDTTPLDSEERARYAAVLRQLEVPLFDGEASTANITLQWASLDDEKFEQLCYDYVFAHPDFDKDRIEKMGKSRSRDGGRDIVAWTLADRRHAKEAVKFIFQCKHIRADGSLTPKALPAISDVIEQYQAGGYGVMCCGYIDATLHDRVDAIAASRNLAPTRKIDRFVLERFLARRPHLVERYFGG